MSEHAITLWLTGFSGAGKTTMAHAIAAALRSHGRRVECLDGDELRAAIGKGLGFSREDRMENIRRIVYISGLLARNGIIPLVSVISPYRDMRAYAREQLAPFVEVFVDCPLAECERRDPKGLYARARQGAIPMFTGVSDVYEPPEAPEIILPTDRCSVEDGVQLALNRLKELSLLT
ncbi:adenylyl-sulfate kinase [Paenibacillus thiaminolyticus]|uniref:Adenylyl-sulfate kinase n=1 Tax=Paenibacillus thiaminolyticus TaxID=49283 RepID=A0AAP9DU75_PANTH|nr:adenylyl-sulfate kinase [Paenibacillus thiaminolyticus]MCY9533682.1 adenylyl-sulfate kinase [Paenibacillus thiaminolyticus]MCY9600904.1 adenylyl-sulfate kinase [Paenibacillus thiaminolyticus]MCY9607733.1 adenylyl-sulfate kinase [Paenibacillus thiaminolyticus]MCY9611532.1 adenylyl-sulfate kinase [Paenibacillus thiaminolyticus]MCY9617197.1 adenylyl-sulfate kinase [Paenibacillus thiaminolyticus]